MTGDASKMKVVPYLEKGKTYDTAFIAVNATEAASGSDPDAPTSDKGSGGCDALSGGLLALAALCGLLPVKRRK